jgi:hypothetical protein
MKIVEIPGDSIARGSKTFVCKIYVTEIMTFKIYIHIPATMENSMELPPRNILHRCRYVYINFESYYLNNINFIDNSLGPLAT